MGTYPRYAVRDGDIPKMGACPIKSQNDWPETQRRKETTMDIYQRQSSFRVTRSPEKNDGDSGWSTPSVPTAIQELHWDNYPVVQNVDLSTGKVDLLVGHSIDMATQTWTNTLLATRQAAIPSLTHGTMQHTSTNCILMGNHIRFGSLSPGTIRLQYNWQWGPHQINYDPHYFNIYVHGYAPFNIPSSRNQ